MSSRPIIQPHQVITNGDMTTTLISEVTIITNISVISYTYTWTGVSPSGTISVQVSNDYTENEAGSTKNAGTWNTLPISPTATVSGNTGMGAVDVLAASFYAIRTVYTPISGTGSLNAVVKGK